ncbi:MAG TPA: LD-carboxypeptidase [Thermotogota bacterium]|nr:LD-carboxypeptidase [Thermotogota bacterium]
MKLGVSSPASRLVPGVLSASIAVLEELGFSLEIGESCTRALCPAAKAKELVDLSTRCDAILCARGGCGSFHLLDFLPEGVDCPIIGYSDITSLLLWQYKKGKPAIHGPMLFELGRSFRSRNFLVELLEKKGYGEQPTFRFPRWMETRVLNPGTASGRLVAGNLSVMMTVLAHVGASDILSDSVLLLEDTSESVDSIERFLWQLQRSPGFAEVRGIVFCAFTRTRKGSNPYGLLEMLRNFSGSLTIPVRLGFPAFHGSFDKFSLLLGSEVQLESDSLQIRQAGGRESKWNCSG